MQLGARRRGWRLRVVHPPGQACPLADLLDLVGLTLQVEDVVAEASTFLAGRDPPS